VWRQLLPQLDLDRPGTSHAPRFADQRVPYANDIEGHQALEGSAGYTPYLISSGFRYVKDMEIGDVGSTLQGVADQASASGISRFQRTSHWAKKDATCSSERSSRTC